MFWFSFSNFEFKRGGFCPPGHFLLGGIMSRGDFVRGEYVRGGIMSGGGGILSYHFAIIPAIIHYSYNE